MKKLHSILALLAVLMMIFAIGCDDDSDIGGGDLWKTRLNDGTISGTKVLTVSESPYYLDENLIVPAGATLEVEPGVVVYADSNKRIEVRGTLNAIGEEENFIHFTTAREPRNKGDWKGIWLIESDNSMLEFVQVSYAAKYDIVEDTSRSNNNGVAYIDTILHRGAITIRDCSPTVKRCIIDNAGYDGIHIVGQNASPIIIQNSLVLNAFNGIRVEPSWPLDNAYGSPLIKANIIVENDDAGIRMPSVNFSMNYVPEIMYNNIWNNASPNYVPLEIGDVVETDVHLNPEFIDIDELDLHLHPCSGALDKGDPSDPVDPDGTIADVGVFPYFQASNALSHTLEGDELHLTTDYEYYEVTCDVTVAEGTTLIIDPGVEIRFAENFGFVVKGAIEAVGTAAQPIVFTSGRENPQRGDWLQLRLENVNSDSRLEHVIIEYGSVDDFAAPEFLGALSLTGSSPVIRNVTIDKSYRVGLYCNDGSSPDIEGLDVVDAREAGVYVTSNSNPEIRDARISVIEGYAVFINLNSDPVFKNVLMHDFTVSGVVVEYYSNPEFDHITLHGANDFGFRVTNTCNPYVKNSIISHYTRGGVTANISSFPVFDYCNLYNEESAPTTIGTVEVNNEVVGNPAFNSNYEVGSSSPCKGAADDNTDLGYYGG